MANEGSTANDKSIANDKNPWRYFAAFHDQAPFFTL